MNSDDENSILNKISVSLDTKFKIPLKKEIDDVKKDYVSPLDDVTKAESIKSPADNCGLPKTTVNKSFTKISRTNENSMYFQNYYVPIVKSTPPPPPPPGTEPVVLAEEKNTYKRRNEVMLNQDQEFPAELKALLRPLSCELCKVTLNSVISAKTHYESKNHEKKINGWLQEWAQKTGEPSPKKFKIVRTDVPIGPNAYHCDVCDLALTSLQHAQQHYSGKKHNAAVAGRSKPSGSGYYGNDGKWIRQQTKVQDDPTNRFGIGKDFLPKLEPPEPPANISQPTIIDPKRFCSVCSISVSSESQMAAHLEGIKHAKKLKAANMAPYAPHNDTILASLSNTNSISKPTSCHGPAMLSTTKNTTNTHGPSKIDISIYRTPSGSFYCSACNITLTDENNFQVHLNSQNHFKNSAPAHKADTNRK